MRCQRAWCGVGLLGLALLGAGCGKKGDQPSAAPSSSGARAGGSVGAASASASAAPLVPAAPVASGLPLPTEVVSRAVNPRNLPAYAGPTGGVKGVITAKGDLAPATAEHLAKIK
ncbi:MAG TPA: hypothetical protein VEQ58_05360, partial [Polyangiaceae bacterium]|nr:hypothetical protein [Polyangiaceae bacterium]